MNLKQAAQLARQLMNDHGVTKDGWIFKWGNGKRQLGSCQVKRNRTSRQIEVKFIKLSRHLVRLNDDEEVRDTILHEIAHALVGIEHGHDAVWQAKCREIGAKPERLAGEEVTMVECRYRIVCGTCQKVLAKRHRRINASRLKKSYCKTCGVQSKGQLRLHDSAVDGLLK